MNTNISKLAVSQQKWHSNMTELNHLGESLKAKPTVFNEVMDQIFSAKVYAENPLTNLLMKTTGGKKEIGGTEWEWTMKGANKKPGVVMKNPNPVATSYGTYNMPYKLALDTNDYKPGDVLSPATANKIYQSRIISTPVAQGDSWIYTLQVVTNDSQLGVPVAYFTPNSQWIKLYSTYEEGAVQSGSVQFSDGLSFRNRLSKFRKSYQITDYAAEEVLAVVLKSSNGKMNKSWFNYAEVEFWTQWYRELEVACWYNRKSDKIDGSTGRPVRTFPGIQEQLEDSHTHKYSTLSAKLLEEFLMDIFYSRVSPGKGRHIQAWTGEYGMLEFNRVVEDWINGNGFLKNIEVTTNKTSSEYHTNALSAGHQYTEFKMANGSTLTLNHNPLYDDRSLNTEIDPITGYPVESMRFTFLDLAGQSSGKSNIQMVCKKDAYKFWYVDGGVGHLGPAVNKAASHAGEYYEMHVSDHRGIHIEDISKCGELILQRN
jgi:hypothetical protein